jgi:hypothetical protein
MYAARKRALQRDLELCRDRPPQGRSAALMRGYVGISHSALVWYWQILLQK